MNLYIIFVLTLFGMCHTKVLKYNQVRNKSNLRTGRNLSYEKMVGKVIYRIVL